LKKRQDASTEAAARVETRLFEAKLLGRGRPAKLRFVQGDFEAILPHPGVLPGLSAALSLLAARYFKIRD